MFGSFESRKLLGNLLHISDKLSLISANTSEIIREIVHLYDPWDSDISIIRKLDKGSRSFLETYYHDYKDSLSYRNKNSFSKFTRLSTGISNHKELVSALILGGSYTPNKKYNKTFRHMPYRYRGDHFLSCNITSKYKVGSKILKLDPFYSSYSLNADLLIGEFMDNIVIESELNRKFSNSVIFRNITVNDRRISIINKSLPVNIISDIEKRFKYIANILYSLYGSMYYNSNKGHVTGFIKKRSYIDHAKAHLGCKSAISVDISKFYNNISLINIIQNNLFYDAIVLFLESVMKMPFIRESFKDPYHYDLLNKIVGMINLQFIDVMSFLTHNGLLPTGAHYSPNISNILLCNVDSAIMKEVINKDSDLTYTRYADDMCISSKKGLSIDREYILNMDMIKKVETIINKYGFHLNYDKTKIMSPRDKKEIAGIILDHSTDSPKLSIGTAKKMELRNRFEGKEYLNLNTSERGILNWVKTINEDQYNFISAGIKY